MTLPQPVFARSFGTGPRQVLAVHCSLAHSGTWRGVAAALEGQATVHAFDLLTHGRSPDWDGQGDYQLRNVQAGLAQMHQPMDLIGHSFGATVALRMAVERPDLVRSLTLIEPVFFAVALRDDPPVIAELEQASRGWTEAFAAGDQPLAARLFNRMWSSGAPRWPDLPDSTRAAMVRAISIVPACNAAIFDDAPGLLAPGGLDPVSMPVLLLHGAESQPVIATINAGLCARLGDARVRAVAGAGHMLPISHPQDTAQLLQDFWRG